MIVIKDLITNNRERNYSQVFEDKGVNITRKALLPGHYYSVDVEIPNMSRSFLPNSNEEFKDNPTGYLSDKQHYDLNPMGLALAHPRWKENLLMVDFKVIPPKYHMAIYNAHLNLIESSLDRLNVFDKDRDMIGFDERAKTNLPMYGITAKILSQASGVNIYSAVSAYKLKLIKRARLMDWDNIGELPMASLETKGIVLSPGTINISRVYELFEQKQY
jgi:hypothetical protein